LLVNIDHIPKVNDLRALLRHFFHVHLLLYLGGDNPLTIVVAGLPGVVHWRCDACHFSI
jgi:hypothetical protein